MRLLSSPIYRSPEVADAIQENAIVAFESNGTYPDALILIRTSDDHAKWQDAPVANDWRRSAISTCRCVIDRQIVAALGLVRDTVHPSD